MANENRDQVTFRKVNLAAKIKQSWGTEWGKPDVGYRFGSREFNNTDKTESGLYESGQTAYWNHGAAEWGSSGWAA